MPGSEGIALAARRVVEFESIQSKLHVARREAITDFDTCIRTYRRKYSGQREIRRDLNQCEWATYRYANLLHMLGEMVRRTNDEFGTRLRDHAPVRHEVPELVGLRHCIHHRGLVGANIVETAQHPHPAVCIPIRSVERHGDWGGDKPDFQTFFHGVSGDALVLRPLIERSESACDGIVAEIIAELEELYGEDELLKTAASSQLYP